MKRWLLIFLPLLFLTQIVSAAAAPIQPDSLKSLYRTKALKMFVALKPAAIEKLTGKKFSLFEKVKIRIAQKVLKKTNPFEEVVTPKQKKQGRWAMILGLASIALLFLNAGVVALVGIAAAVTALVLGIKSTKGNSNTPGLIGIIAGSLTLLLVLLAIIWAATFFGGFF